MIRGIFFVLIINQVSVAFQQSQNGALVLKMRLTKYVVNLSYLMQVTPAPKQPKLPVWIEATSFRLL
jgi:hypothetical protein